MTGDSWDAHETFVNVNLTTTNELVHGSAAIDRYFSVISRDHPGMRVRTEGPSGDLVLESDRTTGSHTWIAIEPKRWSCGQVDPSPGPTSPSWHEALLEATVRMLPIQDADCETLDLLFGFDLLYAGNHDEILARTLGLGPALGSLLAIPGSRVIDFQPSVTLALDSDCLTQYRLSVESRTNASQVRIGDYPDESLSVYFAVREHLAEGRTERLVETLRRLQTLGQSLVSETILPRVIRPLAQAIASA